MKKEDKIENFKIKHYKLIETLAVLKSQLDMSFITTDEVVQLFESNKWKPKFLQCIAPFGVTAADDVYRVYNNPIARLAILVSSQKGEYMKNEIMGYLAKINKLMVDSDISNPELIDLVDKKEPEVDDTLVYYHALTAHKSAKDDLVKNIPVMFFCWLIHQRTLAGECWIRAKKDK
jgi:hypothetical protein